MPNEWWGRLGLTEPGNEGEQESVSNAAADPQTADAGAQEPEVDADSGSNDTQETVAAPAADTQETDLHDDAAGASVQKPPENQQQQELTPEQRHENAARRRQAEAEQEKRKITEDVLKSLKIHNPYANNAQVTTIAEYEQYQKDMASAKMQRELKSGDLSVETIEEAMLASPKIRQIVENADAAQAEAKAAQAEAGKAQYQADMQRQIAEIQKINPQVKSINDIIAMDSGLDFARYVRTGLTPLEAYKLANYDQIVSRTRSAAEQSARNSAAGKQHLQATKNSATTGIDVSEAMRERYHKFCPNATDAEIAAMEKSMRGE